MKKENATLVCGEMWRRKSFFFFFWIVYINGTKYIRFGYIVQNL